MCFIVMLIFGVLAQGAGTQSGTGSIEGHLRGPDGTPMVRVRVTALSVPEGQGSIAILASLTQTDDSGAYHLGNVAPGRYYIAAGPIDGPIYHPGVLAANAATVVAVTAGSKTIGMDFAMVRPLNTRVLGRVVREGNQDPPSGRRIVLSGGGRTQLTFTGPDGGFDFQNVRPGTYSIAFVPPLPSVPQTVEVRDMDVRVELRIPVTREITGAVGLAVEGPSPHFTMTFASANFTTDAPVENGRFQVELPAGEYRVSQTGLPAGFTLAALTAASVDLLQQPFKLSPNESGDPNIAAMLAVSSPPPWHKLTGRVVGAGNDATAMLVSLIDARPTVGAGGILPFAVPPQLVVGASAAVDADGQFEFPRVLPGRYIVRLDSGGLAAFGLVLNAMVTVSDRDIQDVELVFPPRTLSTAGEVPVQLVVEGGGPIPRFGIVNRDGGPPVTLTPNAGGTILLQLIAGDHPFEMSPVPPGYSLRSVTYGGSDLIANPTMRNTNTRSEELRITLGPEKPNAWVKISGRVSGLDLANGVALYLTPNAERPIPVSRGPGSPSPMIASRIVSVTLAAPGVVVVPLRPDGTFEIPAVLQGSYRLSLSSDFPALPAAYTRAQPAGLEMTQTIDVQGRDLAGLEIRIPPLKQLAGRVIVENDNPQPSFRLMLSGGAGPMVFYPAPQLGGLFRVNLPEGEYRMSVSGLPDGYSVRSLMYGKASVLNAPIKITAGEDEDLTIELNSTAKTLEFRGSVDWARSIPGTEVGRSTRARISISGETQQDQLISDNGSFLFPRVIPDLYNIQLVVGEFSGDVSLAATALQDVRGVRFLVVPGRVTVEGGERPSSLYYIEARNTTRDLPSMTARTLRENGESQLAADGTFALILTGGEQQIRVGDLPAGYSVKSITYGSADVTNRVLKINPSDPPADLSVVLSKRTTQ